MKKCNAATSLLVVALLLLLTPVGIVDANKSKKSINYKKLRNENVTVVTPGGSGSGTVFSRTIGDKKLNFVITAAHVIESLKITSNKDGKKIIRFNVPLLFTVNYKNSIINNRFVDTSSVIKYSESYDIAILRVTSRHLVGPSRKFYNKELIPSVGTDIIHVGSMLGRNYLNSVIIGRITGNNRKRPQSTARLDQTDIEVIGGCSGGAVFLPSGEYIGMIVRRMANGGLFVPIREILAWAEKEKMLWLFDKSAPTPSLEEINKINIHDSDR